MNIFVLDENPELCAKYHNNKHVVKMILETAQLLSSAYYNDPKINIENFIDFPREKGFLKLTHYNHPCTKWTRETIKNWEWLLQLFYELNIEYTFRYNKKHSLFCLFDWFNLHKPNLSEGIFTQFKKAMPQYIIEAFSDPVEAYRMYYILEKWHLADWHPRCNPIWYNS